MNDIVFKVVEPHILLAPYVSRIFVFECKQGITIADSEVIVPNGQVKIVIPYRNNMKSTLNKQTRVHKESSWIFIGPSINRADIECDDNYGNICIEFKPMGAYRFFKMPMHSLSQNMFEATELFDRFGNNLQDALQEIELVDDKISFVQSFLCRQLLSLNKSDSVTEYAVSKIIQSKGLIAIQDLSDTMGYSRRFLTTKFSNHVGLSPKELSSIIRFQEIIKNVTKTGNEQNASMYDYFYDQSHYIKEFKRFTGYTPTEYLAQCNKLRCLL